MDQKQKEQLRILLKARKRADKTLAKRRETEQKKLDYKMRKDANQELMKQYAQELTSLAEESGLLTMVKQAVIERDGKLTQQVSYYIYYGISTSSVHHTLATTNQGELRASYMALRITWGQPDTLKEAEVRIHKKGQITFHNSIFPVFPFFYRRYPQLLQKMLTSALEHPRPISEPLKTDA